MSKIIDFLEKHEIKFDWKTRGVLIGLLVLVLGIAALNTWAYADKRKDSGDKNVYLNEEVCFADEIYIAATSINVMTNTEQDGTTDEEGDTLSSYTLNLGIYVEQRHEDFWTNKVKIKPSCFKLKSVNLQAKSKMAVFFECLAKETLSIIIGGAVGGSINIIEETINYIADYTESSIVNASNSAVDFKPIKCDSNSFEPFYPYKNNGKTYVDLSFPIKTEYLESNNLIVLAIDDISHIEKRIFLTTRPSQIVE